FHVVNNIPYFTIQSYIEDAKDNGVRSEAYASVSISSQQITVKIRGAYPTTFSHERPSLMLVSNC
ncbi:MAG: hypothetical protein KDD55_13295, partial [Bdellovibrionales bacterium]|nr:hypothetical protein [Bdellovibrionales bacterium]